MKKSNKPVFSINPINWNIQNKIISMMIVVLIVALGVMAVLNYVSLSNSAINNTSDSLGSIGNEAIQRSVEVINGDIKSLQALALSPSLIRSVQLANGTYEGKSESEIQTMIADLDKQWVDNAPEIEPLVQEMLVNATSDEVNAFMKTFPNEVEVFITDKYGMNIGMSARTGDYWQGDEGWWQKAFTGETSLSAISFDESANTYAMNIGVPVRSSRTQEIIGVLRGTVNVTAVFNELAKIKYGETGRAALMDNSGTILYSPNSEQLMQPAPEEYIALIEGKDSASSTNLNDLDGNPAVITFQRLEGDLANILNWVLFIDQDLTEVRGPVIQTTLQNLLVALLVGGLLAIMGIILARSIAKPILKIARNADELALGNASLSEIEHMELDKIAHRKDELGIVGRAFTSIIEYYKEMAQVAREIADGNLVLDVTPKSDKDELGNAFEQMIRGLRESIGKVNESVRSLAEASEQLSMIADQAGEATGQIATTIQQVAHGTSQQSESVNQTAASVDQLSRAIDSVATGAQEQASSISMTSSITADISTAILQVAGNAQAVVEESNNAANAAKEGTKTVEATLTGMHAIKQKVDISAQKVQEMGKRSNQIGEIVTAIEDIASQTNLLALNAAIEAARAGEAGKGFAVVADEVRKLAERSSAATKEIGDIIKGIQKTVGEAVIAMDEGANEVDNGVTKANDAGNALVAILNAADAVSQQAIQASSAVEQMSNSANKLVTAVDSVSAIVEENTAATEEMAASSSEVSKAIENIASVSEENSAAVQEVSASAEEIAAQVQQVNSSAKALADLAKELQIVINKFRLNN